MQELLVFLGFIGWAVCIILGWVVGDRRNAGLQGALMAAVAGPLGVIAALGLDKRLCCPRCSGRLDGKGAVCQHCQTPLCWKTEVGLKMLEPTWAAPPPATPKR
jgi:hypothetical protein